MVKKGAKGRGAAKAKGGGAGGGGGGSGGGESDKSKNKNLTVVLLQTGGADPYNASLASAGKNKVRFQNATDRGLTVTFDYWPFLQPPLPIPVDSGKKSKWFDVIPNVTRGKYTFSINPDLTSGSDRGPDPPGLSFNG